MSRRSRRKLAKVVATPGSRVTSMSAAAVRLASGNATATRNNYSDPSAGIVQGNGADYFGPENPIRPQAPPEVAGRIFDFPVAYNLDQTTRAYEPIRFEDLRQLADSLDVLRLAIDTRKDQMEKLDWGIKSRLLPNGKPATNPEDPGIAELTQFFQFPDKEHDWHSWLRALLEDVLVIDAPAIFCRKTRGGQLYALEQIDGGIVKRVIDDWGKTPAPPSPAYQEILKGMPAINYVRAAGITDPRVNEMIYMPRNSRVHKVYGYSPVEQVVMTIQIALRRQMFQLQYFTEGNMPEGLLGAPSEWSLDQIVKFQEWFDATLAGNTAARRRIRVVPGDAGKSFQALREPDLTGRMDEWLVRVICFAFSLSPQPFVSMMNRATAQSAHDAALSEGLAPLMGFVKRLMDRIISIYWPKLAGKLEFEWNEDRETDPAVQATVITTLVSKGLKTINEGRDDLGLEPDPDGDVLRVLTGTGYARVGVNDDAPTAGEAATQKQESAKAQAEALANRPPAGPATAAPVTPPASNATEKLAKAIESLAAMPEPKTKKHSADYYALSAQARDILKSSGDLLAKANDATEKVEGVASDTLQKIEALERSVAELASRAQAVVSDPPIPFAKRSAAFLADIQEMRALGFEPDFAELARLHGVPVPARKIDATTAPVSGPR